MTTCRRTSTMSRGCSTLGLAMMMSVDLRGRRPCHGAEGALSRWTMRSVWWITWPCTASAWHRKQRELQPWP
eukprot:9478724-Heterocapsa_arctica.AAC.1